MAHLARQSGLEVEIAKFEDWGAAGRTFDIVVAGQTWHWVVEVDRVPGASKAAEVLRPSGRVASFWYVMSFQPELAQGFSAVYRCVLPEFPFLQNGSPGGATSYAPILDKTVEGIRRTGKFGQPEQWQFDWERRYAATSGSNKSRPSVATVGSHRESLPSCSRGSET